MRRRRARASSRCLPASRHLPANARNSHVEFESADDFVLTSKTKISHASFTGLLTGGAKARDLKNVVVEIYRVLSPYENGS